MKLPRLPYQTPLARKKTGKIATGYNYVAQGPDGLKPGNSFVMDSSSQLRNSVSQQEDWEKVLGTDVFHPVLYSSTLSTCLTSLSARRRTGRSYWASCMSWPADAAHSTIQRQQHWLASAAPTEVFMACAEAQVLAICRATSQLVILLHLPIPPV